VRNAIEVTSRLRLPGRVRLDSGDLATLARMARAMLDQAGLADARIFASGSLDEYALAALAAVGTPIDAYGVGTKMGVSADAPYLDSACKLAACAGRPVMKLSAGKTSPPGAKQVYRGPEGDVLALREEPSPPARWRSAWSRGHMIASARITGLLPVACCLLPCRPTSPPLPSCCTVSTPGRGQAQAGLYTPGQWHPGGSEVD